MSEEFDLRTSRLAVGDPTMGLALYSLSLPSGTYRLGPKALRQSGDLAPTSPALIKLESPCLFALDEAFIEEFKDWYHRIGNECSYMVLTIVERLTEIETTIGGKIAFYWEHDVAGTNREGQYVLDPTQVLKIG